MSRFNTPILEILAAGAAIAAASLAFAPAADAQETTFGVEVTAGASYYSVSGGDSEFDLSSWGFRTHRDWNDRWGLEFSYTNQDQDSIDAEIYEASARFTFFSNDRVRVFALAGAGLLSYDYVLDIGGGAYNFGSDDTAVYHLGIAAEIALGDRFYLRPDLRNRWAIDLFAPYDDSSSEATLGFGYRF